MSIAPPTLPPRFRQAAATAAKLAAALPPPHCRCLRRRTAAAYAAAVLLIVACPRRSQRCIRFHHLQVATAANCRPRLRERRTVAVDAMVKSV